MTVLIAGGVILLVLNLVAMFVKPNKNNDSLRWGQWGKRKT